MDKKLEKKRKENADVLEEKCGDCVNYIDKPDINGISKFGCKFKKQITRKYSTNRNKDMVKEKQQQKIITNSNNCIAFQRKEERQIKLF